MGKAKGTATEVLRWIAVLPAAFTAGAVAGLIMRLIQLIFWHDEPAFWAVAVQAGVGTFAGMWATYHVAPRVKLETVLIVGTLWALAGLMGVLAAFFGGSSGWETFTKVARNLPYVIVPFATYAYLRNEEG